MEKYRIIENIKEIFIQTLEHDQFKLELDSIASDIDGWDSITHLMIIGELEKKFQIKFELMELMNMNTIGDLITTIENKL